MRYAVHNEYACTAVDFLARRSRLTFLNSHVALDALPRVVEIMGDELGWSKWRRNKEIRDAEMFMESMGVPFGTRRYRIGWREWAADWFRWFSGRGRPTDDIAVIAGAVRHAATISRAQFEPGELDRLRSSFMRRIPATSTETHWMSTEDARTLVMEKLSLGWLTNRDVDRVFDEVTRGRKVVDQEEFIHVSLSLPLATFHVTSVTSVIGTDDWLVQVCATLKDLAASPPLQRKGTKRTERRTIPVEKSGGGI